MHQEGSHGSKVGFIWRALQHLLEAGCETRRCRDDLARVRTPQAGVGHRPGKLRVPQQKDRVLPVQVRSPIARNQELREAMETIHAMATRDEVTGLYNRAFFAESLRHALAQDARHGRGLAVLFIDADRFKAINDSLGHAAGDRVLREIGVRIAASVRSSDIVARFGGDEFVVLIEDPGSREAIGELAEKIVRAVSGPCRIDGHEVALSVSAGVALSPQDGVGQQQLMRNADIAMYRAKAQGRNRYQFYAVQASARPLDAALPVR